MGGVAEIQNIPSHFIGAGTDDVRHMPFTANIYWAITHLRKQGWLTSERISGTAVNYLTESGIKKVESGEVMLPAGHQGGENNTAAPVETIDGTDQVVYADKSLPEVADLTKLVLKKVAAAKLATNVATLTADIAEELNVPAVFVLKGNLFSTKVKHAIVTLVKSKHVAYAGLTTVSATKKGMKAA
jgi:hypothetical protein